MKQKSLFGEFYSSYKKNEASTMDDWYEAYKEDPEKFRCINGKIYLKIIHRCEFYGEERNSLLVAIEPNTAIRINDVLTDENNRRFVVKGFEHFHIWPIPEWFFSVVNMVIRGESYEIGEYLRKKED